MVLWQWSFGPIPCPPLLSMPPVPGSSWQTSGATWESPTMEQQVTKAKMSLRARFSSEVLASLTQESLSIMSMGSPSGRAPPAPTATLASGRWSSWGGEIQLYNCLSLVCLWYPDKWEVWNLYRSKVNYMTGSVGTVEFHDVALTGAEVLANQDASVDWPKSPCWKQLYSIVCIFLAIRKWTVIS